MIVQKTFINKLKDFGLNSYESKLWTALLSRGVSTAGELSDIASVPRSRTYDVLESLERKGFIIMKIGKPIKYIAIPPEDVLERVKKRVFTDAEARSKVLNELQSTGLLEELTLLHKNGVQMVEPYELSGSLKGRKNIYNHLETLFNHAEKSIVIVTTPEGLARKMDELKDSLEKAKQRNVQIRIATSFSKELPEKLAEVARVGQLRVADTKARFCIIDGKEIVFMVLDDKEVHPSYDLGIWVKTSFFGSALESMFNTAWENMETVKKLKA